MPELYADLPFMYLFELVADDLCGTVTSLRRRRRWRALPCWDPRGGLAWAPRAACMSGSGGRSHGCGPPCGRVRQGWRRLGCYQPAGWWRCGLAPSRRGVRWPGHRGSWAVSVVRTTALDPNRGMSVARAAGCGRWEISGKRSSGADPAATIVSGLAGVARVSRSSSSRTGSRAGADACSRVRARCDDGLGDQYLAMQGLPRRR